MSEYLEVTFKRTLVIWWALAWRGAVFGFAVGFVAGFVIAIVAKIMGIDMDKAAFIRDIIIMIGTIGLGFVVLNIVLKKKFKEFRIALVPVTNA